MIRQLVVISGKGGTGKTTVTAALAQLLGPLVLADCDVEAPNLGILFPGSPLRRIEIQVSRKASIDPERCDACGLCAERCRFDAVLPRTPYRVDHLSCEGCGVCGLVCPAQAVSFNAETGACITESMTPHGPLLEGRLALGEEASGKVVTRVRMEAQALAAQKGLELVLIDGSPGTGCPVIASLTGCDLALLVTEPTLSAVHDLERVFRLVSHFGIPAVACLNKSDLNEEMGEAVRIRCREVGVGLEAELPFRPEVVEALRHARPPLGNVPAEVEEPLRGLASAVRERLGYNE